jgi:hypothetical protein
MTKRKIAAIAIPTVIILAGFYPFGTLDVPRWRLRVVNESETPYPRKEVTAVWKNYTLERSPGQNFDTRVTDNDGFVEFPERKTEAGLWPRAFLTLYARAASLAHGGVGVHAYVRAGGPQGDTSVNYTPGQPPPAKLVLPSR